MKWKHETIKKTRFKHRKNWMWQLQGYFALKNIKTGRITKVKGFSKTFKNLKDKKAHHKEAFNQALFEAGGTNFKIVKSSYRVIRWKRHKG